MRRLRGRIWRLLGTTPAAAGNDLRGQVIVVERCSNVRLRNRDLANHLECLSDELARMKPPPVGETCLDKPEELPVPETEAPGDAATCLSSRY